MRMPAILLSSAVLVACQAQPVQPPPNPADETKAAPVVQPPQAPITLEGEWRVAGIDGREFNEAYGLALSGSAQELWWEPRCARIVRSYRTDGSAVAFGAPLDAPKAGAVTPAICAIAPPPRIAEVTRALDSATSIARTEQNGILLSGGGHSVLLFSQ